jgi:hypothetical protein
MSLIVTPHNKLFSVNDLYTEKALTGKLDPKGGQTDKRLCLSCMRLHKNKNLVKAQNSDLSVSLLLKNSNNLWLTGG